MLNKYAVTFYFLFVFTIILEAQFKNVRVSSISANQPNEVSIAINPTNPSFIAAGSNLRYFYISYNDGLNWEQKTMSSSWGVWGDPCLVYDADGYLFFGHLSNPPSSTGGYWIDRIVVQRSPDNGTNWDYDAGVGFSPPAKEQDKEWICADITNSKFKNNLYMAWTEFDNYGSTKPTDSTRILFSRSINRGQSWSNPVRISNRSGDCQDDDNTVEGCVPTVGPNGEVYLSWSGPAGLMFDKSLDGGVTFGNDTKVASLVSGWAFNIPGINRCNGMPITGCDISNSKHKGNIYINWSDQINGDTDIFLAKSTDGGFSWSTPKKVNNDSQKRDQFFTWMSVDPITGIIYIIFYDRRDNANPTSLETQVYLARSDDGGETFKNFRISESSFIPTSNVFFGDYTGIAAYNRKVYPIWMRMQGTTLSIWTAPIDDHQLTTNIEKEERIPTEFKLYQNYPNPFNAETSISYYLNEPAQVSIKIFDTIGKEIAELINAYQTVGIQKISFNADKFGLVSGVYICRLTTGMSEAQSKMIYLK